MRNIEFWNLYCEYWKDKIKETKEVPNEKILEELIDLIDLKGDVLEVGCGFGRLFPYYLTKNVDVFAIDISDKMIEEAEKNINKNIVDIRCAKAEEIPYLDDSFDYVICLATFDCLEQEKALSEMLRVLKIGGKLLITGKNVYYYLDDYKALEAEINAKKNGFPNSFTDVKKLIKQLKYKEHKIILEYYYPRRGDFSECFYYNKRPKFFYEYFLCVEKRTNAIIFKKFSKKNSKNVN